MYRLEHQMAGGINQRSLGARIASPQDEHQVVALGIERTDGGIRKLLPSPALVAGCLMGTYGEGGIEQQHSLLGPSGQVARCGHRLAQVELYLLEDVD